MLQNGLQVFPVVDMLNFVADIKLDKYISDTKPN